MAVMKKSEHWPDWTIHSGLFLTRKISPCLVCAEIFTLIESPTSGGHAMAYLDYLLADSFQIKLFTDACGSDKGFGWA